MVSIADCWDIRWYGETMEGGLVVKVLSGGDGDELAVGLVSNQYASK